MNPYFSFEFDDSYLGPTNPEALCDWPWPKCPALRTRGTLCPVHAEMVMSNEASKTQRALREVQDTYPSAIIRKFNDRRQKGLLDAQVIIAGHYIELEFKDLGPRDSIRKAITPIQFHEMRRLDGAKCEVLVVAFRGTTIEYYNAYLDPYPHLSGVSLPVALSQLLRNKYA